MWVVTTSWSSSSSLKLNKTSSFFFYRTNFQYTYDVLDKVSIQHSYLAFNFAFIYIISVTVVTIENGLLHQHHPVKVIVPESWLFNSNARQPGKLTSSYAAATRIILSFTWEISLTSWVQAQIASWPSLDLPLALRLPLGHKFPDQTGMWRLLVGQPKSFGGPRNSRRISKTHIKRFLN